MKIFTEIKFHKQVGVTMIEAMVALFVFSVGGLGLAAMQTATLVQSDDTKQRSLAIWKAQELAERIRSTKTVDDPDGMAAAYVTAIGNNTLSTSGIGDDNATPNGFQCPNAAPARCADYTDSAGAVQTVTACTSAQLVTFDVWEVFCEGNTGLATDDDEADGLGSRGLIGMEIALISDTNNVADPIAGGVVTIPVTDYYLYIEWVNRSADSIEDVDASVAIADVNLCGDDVDVNSKLDVYCLRFK